MPQLLSGRLPSVKIGIPSYSEELATLSVVGISSLDKISVGGSTGADGQYLVSTGIGLTWKTLSNEDLSVVRTSYDYAATAGQTTFNLEYTVGYVDVFVNGVRLTTSEYTASDGSNITLGESLFANDTVDIIKYNTTSSGGGSAETDTLNSVVIRGAETAAGIQVGISTVAEIYTDVIRRKTDNSTNTKIGLDNKSLKLYAGNGVSAKVTINGGVGINTSLNVVGVATFNQDVTVGSDQSTGIVLTSPNGTKFRLVVDNSGNLSTTAV